MYLIFQKHLYCSFGSISEKVYFCTMKCDFLSEWIICQQLKNQVDLQITK